MKVHRRGTMMEQRTFGYQILIPYPHVGTGMSILRTNCKKSLGGFETRRRVHVLQVRVGPSSRGY
jgi:hypothetical protein